MSILKVVVVVALVTLGIMVAPIVIGVLAALLPLAAGAFAIIFPILLIGCIIGYFVKK